MSEPGDMESLIANLESNYYDLSRCIIEFVKELESSGAVDLEILRSLIEKYEIPEELEL